LYKRNVGDDPFHLRLNSPFPSTGVALCNKYGLTAIELMQSLDAFLMETQKDSLELDHVGKFEQTIKDLKQKEVSCIIFIMSFQCISHTIHILAKDSSKK
jgi:hypothetical protein